MYGWGRGGFLALNNKETGPERWSDLSKVTQLLRGGDGSQLRGGGEEGSAEGDNRCPYSVVFGLLHLHNAKAILASQPHLE